MFAPWRSQSSLRKAWVSDYWQIIHSICDLSSSSKNITINGVVTFLEVVFLCWFQLRETDQYVRAIAVGRKIWEPIKINQPYITNQEMF